MPIDLNADQNFRPCTVLDRLDARLPFSKGVLATSILATGVPTPKAYEIAQAIQVYLHENSIGEIGSEALTLLTTSEISERISKEVADRYLLWRKARRCGRPFVISMLGSTGIGKSTLATRLALRLDINQVVTTDAIREVMRTVIPASVLPELHMSSYEAIERDLEQGGTANFDHQAQAVVAACAAVAQRYVRARKNIVFEGVHLVPGYLTRELERLIEHPIVVELFLAARDEELHNARLLHGQSGEPAVENTLNQERFDVIRALQETMRSQANEARVAEFDVDSDDDLTQRIVTAIIDEARV